MAKGGRRRVRITVNALISSGVARRARHRTVSPGIHAFPRLVLDRRGCKRFKVRTRGANPMQAEMEVASPQLWRHITCGVHNCPERELWQGGGRRFESVRGLPVSACSVAVSVAGTDRHAWFRRPRSVHQRPPLALGALSTSRSWIAWSLCCLGSLWLLGRDLRFEFVEAVEDGRDAALGMGVEPVDDRFGVFEGLLCSHVACFALHVLADDDHR